MGEINSKKKVMQKVHKNKIKRRKINAFIGNTEKRKRRREIILILSVVLLVILLAVMENRIIYFGAEFPVSNTILMFILINLNLLLLILLIFLVFRNLVKLLYDRRRKVAGAKLRTKLVLAFISLSLLPTMVLFFFSLNFITSSIEFWFNVPVEQALNNSLNVGRLIYRHVEEQNRFYLQRIAYQINVKNFLSLSKKKDLSNYIQVVQREFNLHAVEVYHGQSGKRLSFFIGPKLRNKHVERLDLRTLKQDTAGKGVHTISKRISRGELIRTVSTVPFKTSSQKAQAFLVLSVLMATELADNLSSISTGVEEYQQIKLLKKPIQATYYITISIVALLVIFCAIWFGFHLAKSISIPIMELAEGTHKVAEGDLSFSIAMTTDDEIGTLVDSFNKMTRDLRLGREQLETSARQLREQNMEIEARRRYIEIILENISTGVITIDAKGIISTANKSAEKMLAIDSSQILHKNYTQLLQGQHLDTAGEVMEKLNTASNEAVIFQMRLVINGSTHSFLMHANALKDDYDRSVGVVIVFDDLTDQEKAQRMAAWREVARRIAHEVKNPLTPIKLSAQRLKRRYSKQIKDSIFDECTHMIIDHVDLIRNLVNEFSEFARFPTANPQLCELPPLIEETVALYREGQPNICFNLDITAGLPKINLDRRQIKQAAINLVNNAIAVLRGQGNIGITLTMDPESNGIIFQVSDDGPGISAQDKERLFEPYFSTKKKGMGLGLTIVSSIVADHKGSIHVRDNQPKGTKFIIELPLT